MFLTVQEELSLTRDLDDDITQLDALIEQIEALQESKLTQLDVLQEGFSSGSQTLGSTPELLVAASFNAGCDDDQLSVGSFEDLRV